MKKISKYSIILFSVLFLLTLYGCGNKDRNIKQDTDIVSNNSVSVDASASYDDVNSKEDSNITDETEITDLSDGADDLETVSEDASADELSDDSKNVADSIASDSYDNTTTINDTDVSANTTENVPTETVETTPDPVIESTVIDEFGVYTSKDDVALYLHTYGKLPANFITKNQAKDLGWEGGSLEPYAPGKCIGGDYFGNYEGILPDGNYHECDIDTLGKDSRGAKRLVFDDQGNIYYTEDHYASFTKLY